MQHSFFHKLGHILWIGILTLVVVLAFYVSLGRLLMTSLGTWESRFLAQLERQLPFSIEAHSVAGRWRSFSPEIVLRDLRLHLPGVDAPPLELSEGRLELDMFDTLRTGAPRINRLVVDTLRLDVELTADGRFRIEGFSGLGRDLRHWLQESLLGVESLHATNLIVMLSLPDDSERELAMSLRLSRDGGLRRLEASLESSDGASIMALGQGVGNPFRPGSFEGELYLDVGVADIAALPQALLDVAPMHLARGALALELWLSRERGEESFSGRVRASDVLLAEREQRWQASLERLDFDARLVQRRGRWTLFASDVELQKSGQRLELPRVQLDAWGDSLRLRSQDLSLAQLNLALVDLEQTPDKLERTLRTLQPGGDLTRLEFSISDYRAPTSEWKLLANFSDLVLDSWRGAPGAVGAAGYVELSEAGGQVVLDAQQMSLEFPTVYGQPLVWKDLYGKVYVDIYPEVVELSSDIISAQGEEGKLTALFGLTIPLQDSEVGLEMDLLVGLRDTSAETRHKYLPFTLNQNLLDWLSGGITDGLVEEGGFLWRGSLRRGRTRERTVQLFLDVEDARLKYHPAWPPVDGFAGLVLVDDTNVSVWGERARLIDSEVRHLSAEAWQDAELNMWLQLNASVVGDAGDGMKVIQQSPLNALTGDVFSAWRMQGQLTSELDLRLNISDSSRPPEVDYSARFDAAQLLILPADLSFTDISGQLNYRSDQGFSGRGLEAALWGQPLVLSVAQQPGAGSEPARSPLRIGFDTELEMDRLRDWLGLDLLRMAGGSAPVAVEVLVPPGAAPNIRIQSNLQGIDLDLPEPWGKTAVQQMPLELGITPGGDGALLDIELGSALSLQLDVADGVLRGGGLGFSRPVSQLREGRFSVAGHMPVMDAAQWQGFLAEYLGFSLAAAVPQSAEPMGIPAAVALEVQELQVDTLQLWGQDIDDVLFKLQRHAGGWELALETDWLQGALHTAPEMRLDVAYLSLDQLPRVEPGGGEPLQLPDLQVSLRELHRGGRQLGAVSFELRNIEGGLQVQGISGELAGLRFLPDEASVLSWTRGGSPRTELVAKADFGDFGDTLQQFDYERILETDGGELRLALDWPGTPGDFALAEARGNVEVVALDGRFLEAPAGASGALRVVSILNLAEIVSRLSLTHMFESGIPFRELEGDVSLGGGELRVNGLEVRGASSRFQFSGLSDIDRQSMDGELVVTLPVANNLPWVAALAAGPAVAAGVFVVSKVFEKQVDQLSSAVYSIGGSWDDPQVSFSRLFDASSESRSGSRGAAADSQDPAVMQDVPPADEVDSSAETAEELQSKTPPGAAALSPSPSAAEGT